MVANEKRIKDLGNEIMVLAEKLDILEAEQNELIAIGEAASLAAYGLEYNQSIIVNKAIHDWFFRDTSKSTYRGWIDKPYLVGTKVIISSGVNGETIHLQSRMWSAVFPIDMVANAAIKQD